jgi:hypothetical protein
MLPEGMLSLRTLGIATAASALLVLWAFARPRPLPTPGTLPVPTQESVAPTELPAPEGYTITGHYLYDIEALVVSRKNYSDRVAILSPVDFALAWGELTSPQYLPYVEFSQSGRWYRYRYGPDFPGHPGLIGLNSANTHILLGPDDEANRRVIDDIGRGDRIHLTGYLVNVRGPNGMTWNSSKSRKDSGAGACEVLYVTHAAILEKGP